YIPANSLQFPLLLRRWQQGDYFYPLGLNKKKKISRLLIDLKLSATEKEKVFVLETNKKIIWVVGIRLDHRFRLQSPEGKAWHFTYRK
ncbi:MAG: tRNA lysidine(34) synthetase TilS, partial [Ferruginibacter sp.]|nr:tRNA lysidine(34) synthetase TilS [Ferruginibacter sp.]